MSAPHQRVKAHQRIAAAQQRGLSGPGSMPAGGSSDSQAVAPPDLAHPPTAQDAAALHGFTPGTAPQGTATAHGAEDIALERATAQAEGLELVDVLGVGRGTRTWLAREVHSRERFTVTFPFPSTPHHSRAHQQAFERMVQHWAGQLHSHLVPVRAMLGGTGTVQGLVADFVPGTSLAARWASGRVPPEELTPVLTGVARALASLHDHGWVHGCLGAQHVILGTDHAVWVDGYGRPGGSEVADHEDPPPAVSWGHHDRPELPTPEVPGTPADDIKALAVLGWIALTGRAPGAEHHRVPLALICPTVPRHLVLLLEAAVDEDPGNRPTAREFATALDPDGSAGVASARGGAVVPPSSDPAPRAAVQDKLSLRTTALHHMQPRGSSRAGEPARAAPRASSRRRVDHQGSGRLREALSSPGRTARVTGLTRDRSRRVDGGGVLVLTGWKPLALAAVTAVLVGCGWFGYQHGLATPHDRAATDRAASAVSGAAAQTGAAEHSGGTAPSQPPTPADHRAITGTPAQAEQAVRELVAARGEALARGDTTALAAIYLPDSPLARADRATIDGAVRQDGGAGEPTALSSVRIEVDRIRALPDPPASPGDTGAPAAPHRFYTEVVTRGWHGALPEAAHLTRHGTTVRQSLLITAVNTRNGWRLSEVAPVAPQPG